MLASASENSRLRPPWWCADTTLALLPDGVDPEAALLIGDNLATGWVAVQRSGLRPGDVVAIVGGGPVGQLASLAAQVHGAAAVVVSDPVGTRRELAAAQGALPAEPDSLRDVLDTLTDARGADVVIEAVGGPRGLDAALATVRAGGHVVSISAHSQDAWSFPLARSFTREVTVSFAIGDSIRVRDQIGQVVASGVLDPTVVITTRAMLGAAAAGYRDLQDMNGFKVVLDPREPR